MVRQNYKILLLLNLVVHSRAFVIFITAVLFNAVIGVLVLVVSEYPFAILITGYHVIYIMQINNGNI